jgi:hypothetical protein
MATALVPTENKHTIRLSCASLLLSPLPFPAPHLVFGYRSKTVSASGLEPESIAGTFEMGSEDDNPYTTQTESDGVKATIWTIRLCKKINIQSAAAMYES